ncbi:hypothetical protein [Streptomyces harbinensis]|uniref:hypothetical protein n=1 Tax=Streptomyces harbinensis TaxID=1176198 RepID=UPI00159029B9|nr:hypothetical protein [Streptomyces harbinensis]QKV71870.1 hypothetical protein HUT13_26155 [Streptomyces harbinensis]
MEEITYRPLNLRWWLALGASFSVGAVSVSVPFFWGLSTGRTDPRFRRSVIEIRRRQREAAASGR